MARGERRPGWFARYRFYAKGKVPRGHEDWVRERLSLRRWIVTLLLIETFWFAVAGVVVAVVPGLSRHLFVISGFAAVTLLLTPMSASANLRRARAALAPPPAREVLRQIGEPVPPLP